MEESKKRKLDETVVEEKQQQEEGVVVVAASEEHLRGLLEPFRKEQLLDLLVKLGSQYPSVAEEIKRVASADPIHRKLFVRGLAWDTTSETLCAAFRVHGEIEEGAVIGDKSTGKSRGYGFITYKHMESTRNALKEPSKLIDGRLAVCNLACEGLSSGTGTPDQGQRKLYIGGLSPEITSETLLNYFGRHGEIEEGSVAYEKDTNKSRGFGFVTYKTAEAARKAIDDPNKILGGRNVTVKLADTPKGRMVQTQLPTALVQVPIPLPAGYAQPGQAHVVSPAISYSAYPQAVAPYTHTPFQNPVPAAAAAGGGPTPYPAQPPISYAPFSVKKDQVGLPAGAPTGFSGYPYYMGKQ